MGFYMFLPCCTAVGADESEPKLPRWKLKVSWVRSLWTLLDQSLFKHNVANTQAPSTQDVPRMIYTEVRCDEQD